MSGETARREFVVTAADTAAALGSGALDVLATPRLVAWCEAVTLLVADALPHDDEATSVGTRVAIEHVRATPVGGRVQVVAELIEQDGRRLRLTVEAADGRDRLIGRGEVERVFVHPERFLARLD